MPEKMTRRCLLARAPRIPMADGAGEVTAVGEGVMELAVGDAVVSTFFPTWLAGEPGRREKWTSFLGGKRHREINGQIHDARGGFRGADLVRG